MNLLITGAAGFIGSNFVEYMLGRYPTDKITVLDKLSTGGRLENLRDFKGKITFVRGDICNTKDVEKSIKDCNIIINFAAETHVDRSINDAAPFIESNIMGTSVLLDAARKHDVNKFVQISTDEVYGQILNGSFKETDILNPRNPYSATKAGAELLCQSFYTTHKLPVVITRSSNNFGPKQNPEKLIPHFIINALHDKPLPIYGSGKQVRDWLYVKDNCSGIDFISKNGKDGEIYNIGGGNEKTNLEITKLILKSMNKSETLIKFVEDRPGHDFRYSLNCDKLAKLGWKPGYKFEDAFKETIRWYLNNEWWWKPLLK